MKNKVFDERHIATILGESWAKQREDDKWRFCAA
jgi:hypothetical protein